MSGWKPVDARLIVPVTKAASELAETLQRSDDLGKPIGVTQKGKVIGVLVGIETYYGMNEQDESDQDDSKK